jgi:hypothetical protein
MCDLGFKFDIVTDVAKEGAPTSYSYRTSYVLLHVQHDWKRDRARAFIGLLVPTFIRLSPLSTTR